MGRRESKNKGLDHPSGNGQLAFLLAQIGSHAASKFAERIKPLGISPSHAGMMRLLARSAGLNQRELCSRLSILPSRLVVLVDELEGKGLIERRDDPNDRRSYALHLTEQGQKLMGKLGELAMAHGEAMCEGLSAEERSALGELLSKVAATQGLVPGVHPGYRRLGKKDEE